MKTTIHAYTTFTRNIPPPCMFFMHNHSYAAIDRFNRFLLRRAATRAISATPAKSILAQPRSITTFTPASLRTRQQQWSIVGLQRRFLGDDATKSEAAQAAAADSSENFAQTAAEAPVEDGLTPAQQDAQAPPTDAENTVGPDALEAAAKADSFTSPRRPRDNVEKNKTLYVGNLFYEVKEDQIKKVFSRFGEVESVSLISDNRGLSRGCVSPHAIMNFFRVLTRPVASDTLTSRMSTMPSQPSSISICRSLRAATWSSSSTRPSPTPRLAARMATSPKMRHQRLSSSATCHSRCQTRTSTIFSVTFATLWMSVLPSTEGLVSPEALLMLTSSTFRALPRQGKCSRRRSSTEEH